MAVTLTGQIAIALKASSSITSLVPTSSIWADQAPEGTTSAPRIVIREISLNNSDTFTTKNIDRDIIEIDCFDYGLEAARTIGKAVIALLEPYTATYDTNYAIIGIIQVSRKTVIVRDRPTNIKPIGKCTIRFNVIIEVN